MIIEYNNHKKALGLEYRVLVRTPRKIARRIKILAQQIKDEK